MNEILEHISTQELEEAERSAALIDALTQGKRIDGSHVSPHDMHTASLLASSLNAQSHTPSDDFVQRVAQEAKTIRTTHTRSNARVRFSLFSLLGIGAVMAAFGVIALTNINIPTSSTTNSVATTQQSEALLALKTNLASITSLDEELDRASNDITELADTNDALDVDVQLNTDIDTLSEELSSL